MERLFEKVIALKRKIKDLIDLTENEPDLNFDGLPLTTDNRKLLANALEIGLELSQRKQAEHYNNN